MTENQYKLLVKQLRDMSIQCRSEEQAFQNKGRSDIAQYFAGQRDAFLTAITMVNLAIRRKD